MKSISVSWACYRKPCCRQDGNSFIGDGGTADVIRFEQQTGLMLGKNGGSHIQKGIDMAKYIENKILTQDLSPSDRALATQLLEDLYSALGR